MKLFHISDLHIGLRIHNRDMKEDQAYILSQIADRAAEEQPDAILIAGDIYDKAVPSADAAELFDDFVTKLSEGAPGSEIMMISGNHDSGVRLDTFRNILKHHRIHMVGTPPQRPDEHIEKVTLTDEYGDVNFYLLPFVRPSMIRMITGALSDEMTESDFTEENDSEDDSIKRSHSVSYDEALHILTDREDIDLSKRNVLVSHQFYLPAGSDGSDIERMDSERVTVGNIDAVSADVLEKFDYAALGHIHKPMCAGSEYHRYCGTPLACSASEAEQEKAIIIAELKEKHCKKDDGTADVPVSDNDNNSKNKCDIEITTIPLVPLRQVRVIRGTSMEVLSHACDDYVSVTLTDEEDIDVIDIQDRLRNAFPNLLEVKREGIKTADYSAKIMQDKELDPFSLCKAFIGDMDDDEISILSDVINVVQGVSE